MDAGYFKSIFILGVIFQLVGIFTISTCTKYYQIFLSQGVCIGIDDDLPFCPALTVTSSYFPRYRSLANGIAVNGSDTGRIIFPAIANSTLPALGFPWTIRISTITQISCILFLKPRFRLRNTGPILELKVFKEPPYTLFNLAMSLSYVGLYFTFFYLSSFANHILHASTSVSIVLPMILNGVGILGRLLPSFMADKYLGPLTIQSYPSTSLHQLSCILGPLYIPQKASTSSQWYTSSSPQVYNQSLFPGRLWLPSYT